MSSEYPEGRRHSSPPEPESSFMSAGTPSFAFSPHLKSPLPRNPVLRLYRLQSQTPSSVMTPDSSPYMNSLLRRSTSISVPCSTHSHSHNRLQDYEDKRLARSMRLGLAETPSRLPAHFSPPAPAPAPKGEAERRSPAPPTSAPSPNAHEFLLPARYSTVAYQPTYSTSLSEEYHNPGFFSQQQTLAPEHHHSLNNGNPLPPDFFPRSRSPELAAAMSSFSLGEGTHSGGPSHPSTTQQRQQQQQQQPLSRRTSGGPTTTFNVGAPSFRPAGHHHHHLLPVAREPLGPGSSSRGFVAGRFGAYPEAGPSSNPPPSARPLAPPMPASLDWVRADLFRDSDDQFVRRWAPSATATAAPRRTPLAAAAAAPLSRALSAVPLLPGPLPALPALPFPVPAPGPDLAPATSDDRVFRPMESRPHQRVTEVEAFDLMVKGFSPNYRGNPDLERNRSAAIPPDHNCSLFVTGLAPTTTTGELLGAIRDVGRVYATHINGPEPTRGHMTCAAKVVFFERAAAERFFDRFAATGFAIPGHPHHVGRVVWNRIRSSEVDVGGRKSRVLLISGPPALVNEVALCNYLAGKISYQIESVRTVAHATVSNPSTAALLGLHTDGANEQRALMEFRFGSYRCQSESARMALTREFKEFGVFCEFGKDPCDLVSRNATWNA